MIMYATIVDELPKAKSTRLPCFIRVWYDAIL